MISFEEIDENKMSNIIDQRIDLSIKISDDITKFSKVIQKIDFSEEREVPPTSLILTREGLAEAMHHAPRDNNGKFMQFVVFIYAFNGKIFYKKLDNGFYEARVVWQKT